MPEALGNPWVHPLWLSPSLSPVLSASSSVQLAAPHRKVMFKAVGWAARQDPLVLWLQHHQNHYGAIARELEYIH